MQLFEVVEPAFNFIQLVFLVDPFQIGSHFNMEERRRLQHVLLHSVVSRDLHVNLVLKKNLPKIT